MHYYASIGVCYTQASHEGLAEEWRGRRGSNPSPLLPRLLGRGRDEFASETYQCKEGRQVSVDSSRRSAHLGTGETKKESANPVESRAADHSRRTLGRQVTG